MSHAYVIHTDHRLYRPSTVMHSRYGASCNWVDVQLLRFALWTKVEDVSHYIVVTNGKKLA